MHTYGTPIIRLLNLKTSVLSLLFDTKYLCLIVSLALTASQNILLLESTLRNELSFS